MAEYDIERLRNDLMDYFGTAMFAASPVALMDLIDVQNASEDELIRIAIDCNFSLEDYRL